MKLNEMIRKETLFWTNLFYKQKTQKFFSQIKTNNIKIIKKKMKGVYNESKNLILGIIENIEKVKDVRRMIEKVELIDKKEDLQDLVEISKKANLKLISEHQNSFHIQTLLQSLDTGYCGYYSLYNIFIGLKKKKIEKKKLKN